MVIKDCLLLVMDLTGEFPQSQHNCLVVVVANQSTTKTNSEERDLGMIGGTVLTHQFPHTPDLKS